MQHRAMWLSSVGVGVATAYLLDPTYGTRRRRRLGAWKTAPGSVVGHAGLVRFDPVSEHRTRIHIRLSYSPPGGAVAHGVLAVVGADPKSRLDLVRLKTALETGRRPYDAARD